MTQFTVTPAPRALRTLFHKVLPEDHLHREVYAYSDKTQRQHLLCWKCAQKARHEINIDLSAWKRCRSVKQSCTKCCKPILQHPADHIDQQKLRRANQERVHQARQDFKRQVNAIRADMRPIMGLATNAPEVEAYLQATYEMLGWAVRDPHLRQHVGTILGGLQVENARLTEEYVDKFDYATVTKSRQKSAFKASKKYLARTTGSVGVGSIRGARDEGDEAVSA